jgi:glycosyltransferase involved in cell wall biosynthesis
MPKQVVVCFGPGPRFKGGIQNYNTSLALALDKRGDCDVHIVSWTQQYPAIIPREFVDKSSKADLLEGSNVKVHYLTNYNKPSTWRQTVRLIRELKANKVVFQWSIALQGLPLSFIAKRLQKVEGLEVVFDVHFVKQKEHSTIDRILTKRALNFADTVIVHARKTWEELKEVFPTKNFHYSEDGTRGNNTVIKLYHPIYDLFRPDPNLNIEALKREWGLKQHVFLFFGFIRRYKGLDQAIRAFAELRKQRNDVSLVIAGESFWNTLDQKKWSTKVKQVLFGWAKQILLNKKDDEREDQPLDWIQKLGIEEDCYVVNRFIGNEEVHKYFQVSDAVVLFYRTATPSGIESLSYNFSLPLLATRVGHFPETIKDGFNGYLANDGDIDDMAQVMQRFLENPIPRENVHESTKMMSWENYAAALMKSQKNMRF